MNPNSIANINTFLRNNLHNFSKSDQYKITYEFNKFVDNNFYIVFILIFEDKQFKHSMNKTFSKELSIEQINNWCNINLFV